MGNVVAVVQRAHHIGDLLRMAQGLVVSVGLIDRHAIADAGPGDDRGGAISEFLPDLADEDPKILKVAGMGGAPDRREELAVRHHRSGISDEQHEEVELLRR